MDIKSPPLMIFVSNYFVSIELLLILGIHLLKSDMVLFCSTSLKIKLMRKRKPVKIVGYIFKKIRIKECASIGLGFDSFPIRR